jgi:hypothetical protein
MRFRLILLLGLTVAGVVRAQAPLNTPVPLVRVNLAASAGENVLAQSAADRAQEMGFPAVAVELYRGLLARSEGDRARLTLGLASALLDDGRPAEAEQALQGFVGLRGSAWHLRASLAAMQQRKVDAARTELGQVKTD